MAAPKKNKRVESMTSDSTPPQVELKGDAADWQGRQILTADALKFLANLQQKFNPRRLELLAMRELRAKELRAGKQPDFLAETVNIRQGQWQVSSTPADLLDRRVEITGPADAKMMINALNCGAKTFMCDFEDSLSPTWPNLINGQANLRDAVRRTLSFTGEGGKSYRLDEKTATLLVRPRGWHLPERHLLVDGSPLSASLFDFGLAIFHNGQEQLARGTGPYFYLPKFENHLEARLWNDVLNFAEAELNLPPGTIKATVLIETITAAFEMEEILYELRDHIIGLNAGRWDYMFSIIKKLGYDPSHVLPDRALVTMAVPFMRSYCDLLVHTCHKRGAHAMGGMAAFIPSRKDSDVNRLALEKVREDKEREARAGFDGTWIAHPDLVDVASRPFADVFGGKPHQRDKRRDNVAITANDLLDFAIPGAKITTAGVQLNINVAVQYIDQWLKGNGAVALYNLMEDAATAEISRVQLWQWVHHNSPLEDGRRLTPELYAELRDEELTRFGLESKTVSREILDKLVLDNKCAEFMTLLAYEKLQP